MLYAVVLEFLCAYNLLGKIVHGREGVRSLGASLAHCTASQRVIGKLNVVVGFFYNDPFDGLDELAKRLVTHVVEIFDKAKERLRRRPRRTPTFGI